MPKGKNGYQNNSSTVNVNNMLSICSISLSKSFNYVHPPGGGYIIFAFSAVRCPASRMVSAHLKEKY